jgi:hypothetical protein
MGMISPVDGEGQSTSSRPRGVSSVRGCAPARGRAPRAGGTLSPVLAACRPTLSDAEARDGGQGPQRGDRAVLGAGGAAGLRLRAGACLQRPPPPPHPHPSPPPASASSLVCRLDAAVTGRSGCTNRARRGRGNGHTAGNVAGPGRFVVDGRAGDNQSNRSERTQDRDRVKTGLLLALIRSLGERREPPPRPGSPCGMRPRARAWAHARARTGEALPRDPGGLRHHGRRQQRQPPRAAAPAARHSPPRIPRSDAPPSPRRGSAPSSLRQSPPHSFPSTLCHSL